MSNTKLILDNYLGKNTRVTEKDKGNGYKEVCDLDTGDCYTIRMKDGLIERVDNTMNTNKKIQVETKTRSPGDVKMPSITNSTCVPALVKVAPTPAAPLL